ncbi:GntR family transcriptional regulator [Murimonas intestini]|uniref:GntR family transcriptional regulator n=1 Tax=Murimonas intestini TaxID=1337051 RepID=A0AB73T7X8_9FIRM|nr:GntR family transcriptional regulator [Murimonas intestini]MCR1839655.1 GntR family transcriptional regulator [Murimonas intestini]MCR1866498.1 GntR family transcriptional regulator [Murimonas intestini]MCR1884878.1 GntR family transcriptional regulator [Murimonas intestini]
MITIDYQNRMPIYEQIVERFQTLIVNGALEPDTQLPSVRNLAVDLAINPNTIQKAYAVLEQQGFIYPVKGRGNFVSGDSEVKNRKIQAFYRTLKNVVIQGKELGVTRDEFLEKSKEMFEEGQYDRN